MFIIVLLVGALVALDVLAFFRGVDSRPTIGDERERSPLR